MWAYYKGAFYKIQLFCTTYRKIDSKWIIDVHVNIKIIKLLEENIGINLHGFGTDNIVLDITPKKEATKRKNG